MGRAMPVDRRLLRFAHAGQLIIGLKGTIVVQEINHPFRVDMAGSDLQTKRTLRHRPDIGDIAARRRQLAANTVGFRQGNHFNLFRPERGRQRFNVMPVINRQVEPQFRFVDAINQQPAVGYLRHRDPGFKLRVDLKRVRMIVQEDIDQLTGVNQQRIKVKTS